MKSSYGALLWCGLAVASVAARTRKSSSSEWTGSGGGGQRYIEQIKVIRSAACTIYLHASRWSDSAASMATATMATVLPPFPQSVLRDSNRLDTDHLLQSSFRLVTERPASRSSDAPHPPKRPEPRSHVHTYVREQHLAFSHFANQPSPSPPRITIACSLASRWIIFEMGHRLIHCTQREVRCDTVSLAQHPSLCTPVIPSHRSLTSLKPRSARGTCRSRCGKTGVSMSPWQHATSGSNTFAAMVRTRASPSRSAR
jgi:hypothetical protein